MITWENWRERMRADMKMRDYRPRTQSGYELATRLFLDWGKSEPSAFIEEDARVDVLFLRDPKQQARSSINVSGVASRLIQSGAVARATRQDEWRRKRDAVVS